MKKENRLILIDGSAYIFRAYYALPPMNRKDGTPVNAVFGFTNMLVKLIEDYREEKLIVIFDAARENFRNKIFKDYKANRGETTKIDETEISKLPEIMTIVINDAAIRIVDCWSRIFLRFLSVKKPSVVNANTIKSKIVIMAIPCFFEYSNALFILLILLKSGLHNCRLCYLISF